MDKCLNCLKCKYYLKTLIFICNLSFSLKRICDTDEKYDKRYEEYQKYLIARDYQPGYIKK